jgi:hypothetical protein
MCIIGIGTAITVTTVFFRIRKICLSMDGASGSSSKIAPKLRKMGQVVLWLDVIIFLVLAAMLASIDPNSVFDDVPADGSYEVTIGPIIRLLILSLTMFWAYHPLYGKKQASQRPTTTSGKESRSTPASGPWRGSEVTHVEVEPGAQEPPTPQVLEPAVPAEPDPVPPEGPKNSPKDYDSLV